MREADIKNSIIISRSVYDSLAYSEVYYELGSISEAEYSILRKIVDSKPFDQYTIILNPSVCINMQRLDCRRKQGVRKDRDEVFAFEDTEEFISRLHNKFEQFKNLKNILYLDNNDSGNILEAVNWINSR